MKPYLVFILYNSSGCFSCICHSAEETHKYLKELYREELGPLSTIGGGLPLTRSLIEGEGMRKGNDIPPSVKEIEAIDNYMYIQLSNGTSIFIIEPSPYSINEIKKMK